MAERFLSLEEARTEADILTYWAVPQARADLREKFPELQILFKDTAYYEFGSQLVDFMRGNMPDFYKELFSYEESIGILIGTLDPFSRETARDIAETLATVVSIRTESSPSNPEIITEIGQKIQEIVESESFLDRPENPVQTSALKEAVLAKKKMEFWEPKERAEVELNSKEAERKQKLFDEKTRRVSKDKNELEGS